MSRVIFIPGKNLDLCILDKERHFKNCIQWINNGKITEFTGETGVFPTSREKEEEWFNRQNQDDKSIVLAIETKEEKFIGNLGLTQIDWIARKAMGGIIIGESKEWNKGYATETGKLLINYSFNALNLEKVYVYIILENKGSIKVAEKLGFKREGLLKNHFFKNGLYHDVSIMSVFKKDWP